MKYELFVYLDKNDFWFKVLKTPNQKFFDYKKNKLIKQGHKVKELITI
tara:strand:- start:2763 stop:2906 length:144 start_codon:yes stop_codon:yes gene_type:complete